MKFGRDFSQRQLAIDLHLRLEIGESQPGARVAIEMLAQLLDVGARQCKADRVRVSAVAGKQLVARFDRMQQMERRDRSSRTVRFVTLTRDDQRWPPVA